MDIATIFYNQIQEITSSLIGANLSLEQNFPSHKSGIIYISGKRDLSVALKNISYADIYTELEKTKNYNIKLIDGALVQIMYSFVDKTLKKHRLAFFPSPSLEEFQNNPDVYEYDEIYADILSKSIIPTPIRFDYDLEAAVELEHPSSHLTIGQYKNCRIPVFGPISPNMFMDFILRNFYSNVKNKFSDNLDFKLDKNFTDCILDTERNILHMNICN